MMEAKPRRTQESEEAARIRAAIKQVVVALLAEDDEVAGVLATRLQAMAGRVAKEVLAEIGQGELLRRGDVRPDALRFPLRRRSGEG